MPLKTWLTDDEWKLREVENKLSNYCERHKTNFIPCYRCSKDKEHQVLIAEGKMCKRHRIRYQESWSKEEKPCWKCVSEKERLRIEGINHKNNDRYDDKDQKNSITEFDPEIAALFIQARKRKDIKTLNIEDSITVLKLVYKVLGRKNYINSNQDQSGNKYDHRKVLWGVNLEDGVAISKVLHDAGFVDFKITPDRWLSFKIHLSVEVGKTLKDKE